MKTLFKRFLMLLKSLIFQLCMHCMQAKFGRKVDKAIRGNDDTSERN